MNDDDLEMLGWNERKHFTPMLPWEMRSWLVGALIAIAALAAIAHFWGLI